MVFIIIILQMSFNRRPNRIAGPGFHINLRYDDQHQAEAMARGSTVHAKLQIGSTRAENYDIKEQELLVAKKSSKMYHDGYTHAMASCNGFPRSGDGAVNAYNDEQLAEWILQQVQFVGVATTEYKPSKAYSEQGFVAQVGGVTTLINEGPGIISPGDSVSLGLNLKVGRRVSRDKGIPRDKIRFCLVKTKVGDERIMEALGNAGTTLAASKTALKNAQSQVATDKADLKKAKADLSKDKTNAALATAVTTAEGTLTTSENALSAINICATGLPGLKAFLEQYQSSNERVIGKAASYAKPGDRLEVILQPRNPY